jgi:hypothetical protein
MVSLNFFQGHSHTCPPWEELHFLQHEAHCPTWCLGLNPCDTYAILKCTVRLMTGGENILFLDNTSVTFHLLSCLLGTIDIFGSISDVNRNFSCPVSMTGKVCVCVCVCVHVWVHVGVKMGCGVCVGGVVFGVVFGVCVCVWTMSEQAKTGY